MACRERCSLWQVYLHVFVMVVPKIEFSLCVVFFPTTTLLMSIPTCRDARRNGTPFLLEARNVSNALV
jgi:hypothetical protein